MATPLTPTPPNPLSAPAKLGRRAAIGAGLTALAATAAIATAPSAAFAQDDQFSSDNSWVPEVVQATSAWETTQGKGITVAVMDTGINEHPFFEGKDVLPGYSVFEDEADAWNDADAHGTAVAAGVLLAAPEATVMPVRLFATGDSQLSGAMGPGQWDAFRWAVDNGADVLVIPWGTAGSNTDEYLETLQYVIDKGAIIVAAAGNDPGEEIGYPGEFDGVVTVTGTTRTGEIWYENTTTGPPVELAAPADEMTIPLPQGSATGATDLYGTVIGGTSMGSGITAGVAALTWSAHPDLDASNVIQRMIQTAGNGSGDRADDVGYGLVNADQAVHAEGIEPVTENPLGYPMGEAGASGATPDDEEEGAGVPAPGEESSAPSGGPAGASANKESNLSTIIVVAAAVVLVAAAIAVWLVLRGRTRKAVAPADQQQAFNQGPGPVPGGYQQGPPNQPQQQYGPPPGQAPGQGPAFGPPPTGQPGGYSSPPPPPQGYTPPPVPGESPPWPSSDPNRR